jgi:hypothetical protein
MTALVICVMLVLCFGVGAFCVFTNMQLAAQHEREIKQLIHERDQARAEAAVFRRLVIPNFARAEAIGAGLNSAVAAHPSPTSDTPARTPESGVQPISASAAPSKKPNPLLNTRIPWRKRFKIATAQNNSEQQHTNTLAAALLAAAKAKKEQSNVAS